MRALLIFILVLWSSLPIIAQTEMIFHSREELNSHRFANTNLSNETDGFLLDMEEEWTAIQIDSFLLSLQEPTTDVDKLLNVLNCMRRTDVDFQFDHDSILFPIMDHYISAQENESFNIPLFIIDVNFSRLNPSKRIEIDNWTNNNGYNSFTNSNFITENIFCTSFFADTIRNENIHIYWSDETILSNTNRNIISIQLNIGTEIIEINKDEYFDLSSILQDGDLNQIGVTINFSDSTIQNRNCSVFLTNKPKDEEIIIDRSYGVLQGSFGSTGIGTHSLNYTVYYGCGQEGLNKPLIMVAGWGPYVDKAVTGPIINWNQGWPTHEPQLYANWNQANIITEMREAGFDVVIVRFTPPNASVRSNTNKLKQLINWVNEQKALVGSTEENIILGFSAGAICVRLTLQEMEKEHLEENGPHPHTKLYISYDGEHGGANIPLSVQHATRYLSEYKGGLSVFALNYILNAPLSKQLLYYFYAKTGNGSNPGQGWDDARSHLIWWHEQANHSKSIENVNDPFSRHNPGFPAFSRNISISNGMNESRYQSNSVDHFPYPSNYGHILFEKNNNNRKWKAEFNIPGGNRVFYYQTKPWIGVNWTLAMDATTSNSCLLLDNAPGGMMFIEDNPLIPAIELMKTKINLGDAPVVYHPHTQFCFTPTVFTHNIRNFSPTNGKMEYNMKVNNLMFQNKVDYDYHIANPNEQPNYSNYFGYPHLSYPHSHYWEATPFDAVFSWSENSEHIFFNTCTRNDITNHNEEWLRVYDEERSETVKRFIFGEVDISNAYIQNRQYGWNTRENYIYTAEVNVPNTIHVGREVTQRTDFKDAGFLSNSDITLRAGEEILLTPGTDIHSGATFHALIDTYHCTSFNGMIVFGGNTTAGVQPQEREVNFMETPEFDKETQVTVYPNPADGTIHLLHKQNQTYLYQVYNMDGKEVETGISSEKITTFQLPSGIYIVKIQTHENTEIHKVIVR